MLVGLRSLSIDEDEGLGELPELSGHDGSGEESNPNQEPTRAQESQIPTMSTATMGHQNGIGTEAMKVSNVIVSAPPGYP